MSWPIEIDPGEQPTLDYMRDTIRRQEVLMAIEAERKRQDDKFGPDHKYDPVDRRMTVLTEEYLEAIRVVNDNEPISNLRDELIQVAAVAVAQLEGIWHLAGTRPCREA